MTTVNTELSLPYSSDRTVLAIQDTIDRLQWRVLEMSTTRIVVELGSLHPLQTYNFPRMTVLIKEIGDQTRISITASFRGWPGQMKKRLTGHLGQFVNSISLRVQTNSIAINPTVSIGEGQGSSQDIAVDRVGQLVQLKALLDQGVLTQDEFDREKYRVLGPL